jgi:hypothetical protein
MVMRQQFSLRMFLALFVLLGAEFWLVKQGFAWCVFAPLFLAVGLELAGYEQAAKRAAMVTALFWLIFPCVLAIVAEMGLDVQMGLDVRVRNH